MVGFAALGSVLVHAAILALILLLLQSTCLAGDSEEILRRELGIQEFEQAAPSAAREIYGDLSIGDVSEPTKLLQKLWSAVTGSAYDLIFSALRGGAALLAAAFLTSFCGAFFKSETVSAVGACAVSLLCVEGMHSCFAVGREALQSLADLSHLLLPTLCTAAAAGGAVTSSGAKYAVSMLFFDGLITLEQEYATVLLSVYAALAMTARVTEHPFMQMLAGLMKQALKWALILIASLFTCYLSLTGVLTGTVDAAAAKAAKTVISSTLPVVGGILADASSALLSGAQLLRNGIGVIGLFFALAVCAAPYLTLGSHYLVYQIVGGAAASFGESKIGGVIKDLGTVYGFLLGMVGVATVILFVSVITLMKTVTA